MEKLIRNLSKSIIDNLKDAQMAYNWANESKNDGMADMATYFIARAKTRLQMLNEDHSKVENIIKKLETQDTTMPPGRYAAFHDYLIEQRDYLEFCINHFKP